MRKFFLLLATCALPAGYAAAQTPTAPPPAPASTPAAGGEKSNWYIFNDTLAAPAAQKPRPAPAAGPVLGAAPAVDAAPSAAPFSTQGPLYVPLDPDTYRLIDRYAIKYGPDSLNDPHTSVRPYTRAAAARLGERLLSPDSTTQGPGTLSRADRFNAQYLLKDNWANSPQGAALNQSAQPVLTYFYRDQTDLYSVQTKDFTLRVNPVLLLQGGKDSGTGSIDGLRYVNTRGAQVEGSVDQRLGFYLFLTDNQMAVPGYVQNRILRDTIVPHEGYFKPFKAAVIGPGSSAYDFFTARGYVTYAATKHINVQFGHDRNFIGNGYRSLILSDYSAPYFFLKLNTRIWKLNYQNLFTELTAEKENADQVYPKKYLAFHQLSLDVTKSFNIGLFESEVTGGPGRGLEIQYLNPLIFYRAVEQNLGSADNALLGLDFKWNILHTAQLYGQVVLDEFKLKEVLSGAGWWANKQAIQLGAKYIDLAGIRNLDLQLEFNYVRPYTYQHTSIYTAYTNYQQPLAHPMGANLAEILALVSYQPLPRLNLVAKAFYTVQGLDYAYDSAGNLVTVLPPSSDGSKPIYYNAAGSPLTPGTLQNYGGNALLPYDPHPMDYGNRVGQGNKSRLLHTDFTATYQPRLNLFLDAKLIARHQTYTRTPEANGTEVYASLAVRWNIAQRLHEF